MLMLLPMLTCILIRVTTTCVNVIIKGCVFRRNLVHSKEWEGGVD